MAATTATLGFSAWMGAWPLLMAWLWRIGALVGVCLVARLVLAGRLPPSGAGRGLRRWRWLAAPLAAGAVALVELAWPGPVYGDRVSAGQLVVPESPYAMLSGQRVWRVDGDSARWLPLKGWMSDALLHDSGAVAYARGAFEQGPTTTVGLLGPEGATLECELPADAGWTWFDDDGRGFTRAGEDGRLWRVDLDAGCAAAAAEPTGLPLDLAIMTHDRFEPTDDWRVVHVGDPQAPRIFELVRP